MIHVKYEHNLFLFTHINIIYLIGNLGVTNLAHVLFTKTNMWLLFIFFLFFNISI